MPQLLKFSTKNMKLRRGEIIFDLPAGHACPFADKCLAKADRVTGKITDGPNQEFRCYHASLENYRTALRHVNWHNFDMLRQAGSKQNMYQLIIDSLPYGLVYRVHSGGDFFNQDYFDAWMKVARRYPERTFYAYTKALPFWVKRRKTIPANFKLVASYGGKTDYLISIYGLRYCKVVESESEAKQLGLKIDHDDSLAWQQSKSFAVLLHGNGPPGSFQAKLHNQKARTKRGELVDV